MHSDTRAYGSRLGAAELPPDPEGHAPASESRVRGAAHGDPTAFAVSSLSCMHQAPARAELLALRSFAFVVRVANVTLPYLGVAPLPEIK